MTRQVRRTASYAPLTHRRRAARIRLLRTVRLNAVGWAVLLAALTAIGVLLWLATGQVGAGLLATGVTVLLVVAKDRVRWASGWLSLGVDSAAEAAALRQRLDGLRIDARVESLTWDDEVEAQHSVLVQRRHGRRAQAALRDLRTGA